MPSAEEFKNKRPAFTMLVNGQPGSGKTYSAMTFPKVYAIGCDPSGLDILYQKGNEKLLANLVHYEYLHNENEGELRKLFKPNPDPTDRFSIYGCLNHAKAMAKEGVVETVLLDGFNYFVDMRWQFINEFEAKKSVNTGAVDTQGMYRDLGLYLNRFFASELLTMATRLNLNVVVTCHVKRETPDTVEGTKTRAGKVSKDSDISPQIEGSFRQKIEGLVGASLYFEHKSGKDQQGKLVVAYKAYTQKSAGLSTILLAKNRYGLPNPLDLTGKSLYEALMASTNVKKEEAAK